MARQKGGKALLFRKPPSASLRSYDLLPNRSQIALRFEEETEAEEDH
jgi:hypothetical protein